MRQENYLRDFSDKIVFVGQKLFKIDVSSTKNKRDLTFPFHILTLSTSKCSAYNNVQTYCMQ